MKQGALLALWRRLGARGVAGLDGHGQLDVADALSQHIHVVQRLLFQFPGVLGPFGNKLKVAARQEQVRNLPVAANVNRCFNGLSRIHAAYPCALHDLA